MNAMEASAEVVETAETLQAVESLCPISVAANVGDRTDRMLYPDIVRSIEKRIGRPFTLEACTNVDGSNCTLPGIERCHPEKSFLDTDVSGHAIYLNPPFDNPVPFIEHYLKCKESAPYQTSAVLILPEGTSRKHSDLLQDWTLLKRFPKGSKLFLAPNQSGEYKPMRQSPFPVVVLYDSPRKPTYQLGSMTFGQPTFVFQGQVNSTAATMGVTSHKILLDSGVVHCFISPAFVQKLKLDNKVQPYKVTVGTPQKYKRREREVRSMVQLADGSLQPINGVVVVPVQMGKYKAVLKCFVTELGTYDIILGDDWLKKNKATLDYSATCVVIKPGKKRFTLRPSDGLRLANEPPLTVDNEESQAKVGEVSETADAPSTSGRQVNCERIMLTAMQTKRLLEKKGVRYTLVQVSPVWMTHVMSITRASDLDEYLQQYDDPKLRQVIREFWDVFQNLPNRLPRERNVSHTIPLEHGHKPTWGPVYRMSQAEKEELSRQLADMLAKGHIEPSTSPYGAPVLFVHKKDGGLRLCVDYRALNRLTIKNRYPLPRIDDLLDMVGKARFFTSLDLASGYHQIRIPIEDRPKTAFMTPLGHYQWKVLVEGLTNAPSTFQRLMNDLFEPYIGKFVAVYLDDILVFSATKEEHYKHLKIVLDILRQAELYCKIKKCTFMAREVKFLGHIVDENGLRPDPDKVAVVKQWPVPQNMKDLRSFLGLCNYFRKFIRGYAHLVFPMTELLKTKKVTGKKRKRGKDPEDDEQPQVQFMTPEALQAFELMKDALCKAPLLAHYDPNKKTELVCDASKVAIGAVLLQDGHPIAYESRKLIPAETIYDTGDRKLLAVVHATKVGRPYLDGVVFTLVTDHQPNTYLKDMRNWSDRQARWNERLERFSYKWEYRKGRANMADPLSRMVPESEAQLMQLNVITRAMARANDADAEDEEPQAIPEFRPAPTRQTTRAPEQDAEPRASTSDAPVPSTSAQEPEHAPLIPQRPTIDLKAEILRAYQSDSWHQELSKFGSEYQHYGNGMWYLGNRIILPSGLEHKQLRQHVIREHHDTPIAGHMGFKRTKASVARRWYWRFLHSEVLQYCNTCDSCARNKASRQRPVGLLQPLPVPKTPWQVITMDFITYLPVTPQGNDTVVVFVDSLTKMVHLCASAARGLDSMKVARVFMDEVFKHHGIPEHVISDRDARFANDFWQEVLERLGSFCKLTTAYHPETDGQTERANQTLEQVIRHFISPDMTNWDELLPTVEFAMNDHVHEGMQQTPFFLNYGRHPAKPVDLALNEKDKQAKLTANELSRAWRVARQLLLDRNSRMKQREDKRRRDYHFLEGDMVYLSSKNFSWKHANMEQGSCVLSGWDLSRCWRSRDLSPTSFSYLRNGGYTMCSMQACSSQCLLE